MARIYRRPETSAWYCEYRIPGNPKPVRESTKCVEEAAAKRFLEARIRETGTRRVVGPAADRVKFDDLARLLEADYRTKRQRLDKLATPLARLRERFAGRRAIDVTKQAVLDYIASRQDAGAGAASINRELAALRRAFRLGMQAELVASAPHIELLPEPEARQKYYQHGEFLALREAIAEPYRDFITALYHTGIRRTQMASLETRDVFLDGAYVRFRGITTKNGEPHTLPLSGEFGAAVMRAWERRRLDCRFLFHVDGRPLAYEDGSPSQEFRTAWDAARKACGLQDRIMHDFRRSAAHYMSEAGIDEQTAMVVTGHKTPGMYRRYNIIARERVAAAMVQTDEYRAGANKQKT